MLLPEKKERENRFTLALRMGLPIFFLGLLSIFTFINQPTENITPSFYVGATLILAIMVYFFLYMIYIGFEERITDPITKTFTREYLHKLFKKEILKEHYTIVLITIENLHNINETYGIKNGDYILYKTIKEINEFLESKGMFSFPIGHIKGGDFLIGLDGLKEEYLSIFDLLNLKFANFSINGMEVHVIGAIADNSFSKNIDYLVDYLLQQQTLNRLSKDVINEDELIDPNDLERSIIEAIRDKSFIISVQKVFNQNQEVVLEDLFVKLLIKGKVVHQKIFNPVVNRLGLTKEYDLILLDNVAKKISIDGITTAVTIAPTTIRDHHFLSYMRSLLETYDGIEGKIVFILSEIDYYNNTQRYNQIIQTLRDMGVKIALDRFGEYHSSYLYFREIEVDMVRFDSRYTKKIKEPRYQKMLEGLHNNVHMLKAHSWMKMIEEQESLDIAKEKIGIDLFQGRLLDDIKEIEIEIR